MGIVISSVRAFWALSYAALSTIGLLSTAAAITGTPIKNRKAVMVQTLLSNHMAELPWTIILLDIGFSMWLSITGTTRVSTLVKIFNFLNIIKVGGLVYLFKRSTIDTKEAADTFLNQLSKDSKTRVELPGLHSPRFWHQFLNPVHFPHNYSLYENIPYWVSSEMFPIYRSEGKEAVQQMTLDVYRPNKIHTGDDRPVFVYIQGGSWTSGSKKWTGPIAEELISREWIVVSIDYRLAPNSKYPAHLIDCKRAIRWIKDEIRIFGGNPDKIVVGGDSAGGHLAALLALMPNVPEFQPGFENVDTTVHGCVALSARLDLVDTKNYNHYDGRARFIKEVACREGSAESEENLRFLSDHSPLSHIKEHSVPFIVVQGELDILTTAQAARDFSQEFQKKSTATFNYLEIPGGHHAFNVIPSPRSWYTTIAVAEWLSFNFDRHQAASTSETKQKVQAHELVEWGWSE